MDQETLRLLVSGLLTAGAGIGGVLIAGRFNRKNTKDTITAAEEQRNRDHATEHEQWLRDRKVEAYANFLAHTSAIADFIASGQQRKGIDADQLSALVEASHRNRITLLAPRHISEASNDLNKALTAAARAARSHPTPENTALYQEAEDAVMRLKDHIEALMRADLRTEPTPTA
ncbi:UNVERIFIED_ORG: hypothetical protein ABID57_000677 [Arthrobacter sp. UYEF1]